MNFYDFLVSAYSTFVGFFPASIQWLVTLLILLALITSIYNLVRRGWIALLVVVILLPFLIPVLQRFLTDLYHFFIYLTQVLRITTPQ